MIEGSDNYPDTGGLTDAHLLIATRKKGWTFYRRDNRAIERLAKQLKTEI